MNIIYALTEPSGEIRYVGLTSKGLERPQQHLAEAMAGQAGHKANWIRALAKRGESYGVEVLERVEHPEGLPTAEIRWIAHLKGQGARLTNETSGGEGLPGGGEISRGAL